MKIINYARQSISRKDIASVVKVLKSDYLTQGPNIKLFSQNIKKFSKSKNCILFNSATSALHAACLSLGINSKSSLWTSSNSFISSATCGLMCGSKVDFVDIDPHTFNMSPEILETKLKKSKKKPDVIVVVHFAGLPCEMSDFKYLSKKYEFNIIEDASHAIGSFYNNNPTGSSKYSDITVFSFHPVKIITTGEGGAALTNSKNLAKNLELISNQGIERDNRLFVNKKMKNKNWYYEMHKLGFNYRMNEMQSALGLSQMKNINKFIKKRKNIFDFYKTNIDQDLFDIQYIPNNIQSSYHLAVVRKKSKISKKKIFDYFLKKGIRLQSHYIPIHLHPFFQKNGFKKMSLRNTENYYENSFSLPIYYDLKIDEQKKVINALNKISF